MSKVSNNLTPRRRFLTGVGIVATGATLAATAKADNHQQNASGFVPARHDNDTWMDELGSMHRVFIDSSNAGGGGNALRYASNILEGHTEGYGGSDADYGLIVCFRHQSTSFGYNDAIWEKYGEVLSRMTGLTAPGGDEPLSANPMNMGRGFSNGGATIDSLIARGVNFAICNRATRAVSGMVARATNASAEEVYQELIANNIPSSRFVPAGVVAATRSQEYGYSLLYADA